MQRSQPASQSCLKIDADTGWQDLQIAIMEVTDHVDLKEFQSSLLLQGQLFNTGIWMWKQRNLEHSGAQRPAHCPCTEQPLRCLLGTLCPTKHTAESNCDTSILLEPGFLPHTSLQKGQKPGASISYSHQFPDFTALSFWVYHTIFQICVQPSLACNALPVSALYKQLIKG